jgi:hypothetical protein
MKFIITVDVEGDNFWANPTIITTENAKCIPRFHDLCMSHEFRPTYLVDYEMANDCTFQEFGRRVVSEREAEIGMHLHAWNTPPISGEQCALRDQVYITELSDDIILQKMEFMTSLLTDAFRVRPVSHRAGRWAFDERVARILEKLGYSVDCSVTPGISWRHHKGRQHGKGGPDYFGFGVEPYFLDLDDIRHSGHSSVLEVPVTIRPTHSTFITRSLHAMLKCSLAARAVQRFMNPHSWLRPSRDNLAELTRVTDWALARNLPVLQMTFHSSELLPGNPYFPKKDDVEALYRNLESFFSHVASLRISGATLADYRNMKDAPTECQ